MKKLLLSLMAIVLLSFTGNANNIPNFTGKPVVITTFEPGSFSAGVFGCWGSGMCRRDIIVMTSHGLKASTVLTNNLDGTLTIDFDFKSFSKENIEFYANRSTFIMEEEFALNAEETTALRLSKSSRILVGNYEIRKGVKYYSVTVKVSK
jgi:hypothetical protein